MTAVLEGVRILEVAEHTFVPAASALLSDWGAEVIKIEHVQRGDAMRGLASTGVGILTGDVHALLELMRAPAIRAAMARGGLQPTT